ncbi:MAG: amidase [Alphaproteobacteria bacterium]|nr:amidase [Alphaproteobacteria bacterium]
MSELHWLSIAEASEKLRRRALTSVALTEAHLVRIEARDGALKSYARVTAARALDDAKAADAEIAAGRWRGALHGIPIALKDLCDTAGIATAGGMTVHAQRVPERDSTVARRLAEAGAVLLGKLQMTEGAYGAHHPKIPAPVSPWNDAYWVGSSSSGSGVATAAGLCMASLGSDTGGSIRYPSAANGLSGVKPTWGRVSRAGVLPLADSLDHVGPMARSALDAAIVLGAIAGADPDDPTASPHPVDDYTRACARGVLGRSVGLPTNLAAIDDDVRGALDRAAEVLRAAGARTVEVALPPLDDAARDWMPMCAVEAALAHQATYPHRASEYGQVLADLLDLGRRLSALDLARLNQRRAAVTGGFDRLFAEVDLLLLPAIPAAAYKLAEMAPATRTPDSVARRMRYTAPLDMSGHPTLTLPGGFTADGMPVGFQIAGRRFAEADVLAAGHAFQRATDWHLKRPAT